MTETKKNPKTHIITAAQGIQAPYSANVYGKDIRKGRPNKNLISGMDRYQDDINDFGGDSEQHFYAIPGSYVNEMELDPFFHERDDVYMERNSKNRMDQFKRKERARRLRSEMNERTPPKHYFWDEIPETNYGITGTRLNKNIRVVGAPMPSQNSKPLPKFAEYTNEGGRNGTSIVVPSPKMDLFPVATGQSGDFPNLILGSGSCTYPNYNETNSVGHSARRAHRMGFTVVDVIDNNYFLARGVQALDKGTFIDMGLKYDGDKDPEWVQATAMILGDLHVSEIVRQNFDASLEQLVWFMPKYTHLNDLFNAYTISVHKSKNHLTLALDEEAGRRSLKDELILTGNYLIEVAETVAPWGGKVKCNSDNHGDMLWRWLDSGIYIRDYTNRRTADFILGNRDLNQSNALEKAIRTFVDLPDNVEFLSLTDDAIYEGFQCGAHGHKGKNGSRGNLGHYKEAYGKVFTGHYHKLQIMGNAASAGSLAGMQSYMMGTPSTNVAGNLVLYPGATFQAIPIIEGKWIREDFGAQFY